MEAEGKNRTMVNMARSLLKGNGLPNWYWAEVVTTTIYLLNISPIKAFQNCAPYEIWKGSKPIVSHLKFFGSIAYVLVNSYYRQILDKHQLNAFPLAIVLSPKNITYMILWLAKYLLVNLMKVQSTTRVTAVAATKMSCKFHYLRI